uniref:Uncharacterized protein n=1 Tax=Arundo donax TaxID=35708 RepID=A0A0A9H4Q9_ARUDO
MNSLPSLNFTIFKAPSSDPVYCLPFRSWQGTSRPSAKTLNSRAQ